MPPNNYRWSNAIVTLCMSLTVAACAVETTAPGVSDEGEALQPGDGLSFLADRRARVVARRSFSQSTNVAAAQQFLNQQGIEVDTSFDLLNLDASVLQGETLPVLVSPSPIAPLTEKPTSNTVMLIDQMNRSVTGEAPAYVVAAIGLGPLDSETGLPHRLGLIEAAAVPREPLADQHEIVNVHGAIIDIGSDAETTIIDLFEVREATPVVLLERLSGADLRDRLKDAKASADATVLSQADRVLEALFLSKSAEQSSDCQRCKTNAMERPKELLRMIVTLTFNAVLFLSAAVLGLAFGMLLGAGTIQPLVQWLAPLRRVMLPVVLIWLAAVAYVIGYGYYQQHTQCRDVC